MSPCLIGDVAEPEKGPVAGWFFTPRGMMLYPARRVCTCSISLFRRVFRALGFVFGLIFVLFFLRDEMAVSCQG